MTDEIVEFIEAQLAHDKAEAEAARDAHMGYYATEGDAEWCVSDGGQGVHTEPHGLNVVVGSFDYLTESVAHHIARHDPARVLAEVAGKRAILAEVLSWQHAHIDGDTWLSCAQAVDPHDEDDTPGSGCADEKRAGGPCDCGLDRRRAMMLNALAAGYVGRPGFKNEWRLP